MFRIYIDWKEEPEEIVGAINRLLKGAHVGWELVMDTDNGTDCITVDLNKEVVEVVEEPDCSPAGEKLVGKPDRLPNTDGY